MILENISYVEQKIRMACQRAGRKREEITLIAVSKTKPVSLIQEALSVGITDFGENKVQEILEKKKVLDANIKWHMIGHLQRNKVKSIIDSVSLIHSVDSIRLAQKIDEEAKKQHKIQDILVEVNIALEESKDGFQKKDIFSFIQDASELDNIRIRGLMTVAPIVENPEENRCYFRELKKLMVDMKSKNIDNVTMDVLSMGMTGDYEVAIEEGATMVRVGTGIFGQRDYGQK